MKRPTAVLLSLLSTLATACSTLVPAPVIDLTDRDPQAAWQRNLARHVAPSGSIDFEGMGEASEDLDVFVAWIALPRNPTLVGADELAYLVNAYNALAMYNVLNSGVLPESKVRFFYLRELEEDGRRISLYDLENDVIRERGDPRIHFALNCMVRSCPRLAREPFTAESLDEQLDAAAREFLNDSRHVQLAEAEGSVRFSSILDWYKDDFLAVSPTLIDYVNAYRDETIPSDWKVEFLPYDWTLNQTP